MGINKTRFSKNESWDAALNERARLLFGTDWKYSFKFILLGNSHLGKCLTINQGTKSLSWQYASANELIFWSGTAGSGSGFNQSRYNPDPTTPSWVHLSSSGVVLQKIYCKDNAANDPSPNTPAVQTFYDSGALHYTRHTKNGRTENPSPQNPAEVSYYETGEVKQTRYYMSGLEKDSEFGMPSTITYSKDGNVSGGHSTAHGKLDKKAASALIAAAKKKLVSCLIEENQIMALSAKKQVNAFFAPFSNHAPDR